MSCVVKSKVGPGIRSDLQNIKSGSYEFSFS